MAVNSPLTPSLLAHVCPTHSFADATGGTYSTWYNNPWDHTDMRAAKATLVPRTTFADPLWSLYARFARSSCVQCVGMDGSPDRCSSARGIYVPVPVPRCRETRYT